MYSLGIIIKKLIRGSNDLSDFENVREEAKPFFPLPLKIRVHIIITTVHEKLVAGLTCQWLGLTCEFLTS